MHVVTAPFFINVTSFIILLTSAKYGDVFEPICCSNSQQNYRKTVIKFSGNSVKGSILRSKKAFCVCYGGNTIEQFSEDAHAGKSNLTPFSQSLESPDTSAVEL